MSLIDLAKNLLQSSPSNKVSYSSGNFISNIFSKPIKSIKDYFDPSSNGGNNFWSTPTAQGLANVQQNYVNPITNFYAQTNEQRGTQVNRFADKLFPTSGGLSTMQNIAPSLVTKFIGNMAFSNQPTFTFNNKPYSQWTSEEKRKMQEESLNLAMGISGGMENKALGKVVPNIFAKNIEEAQPIYKALPASVTQTDIAEIAARNKEAQYAFNREQLFGEISVDKINEKRLQGLVPVDIKAPVKIYRGTQYGEDLKFGDFVTTDKETASQLGKVTEKTVNPKDLSYNSSGDLIYTPPSSQDTAKYMEQVNPYGLMGETNAQTAFRREAGISADQAYGGTAAKFAAEMEAKAKSAGHFKLPYEKNEADQIANAANDLNKKVNIIDYLRTPEGVLNKIGLGNEAKALRTGWEAYKQDLPAQINQLRAWQKEVPTQASSNKIFLWLDGKDIKLNPMEEEVGLKIKGYLSDWADKLKLPQDKRVTNYITHLFDKEQIAQEFPADIARMIDEKVPGSVYDPFLQQRKDMPDYKIDVWQALDAYTKRAVRKFHMDPPLNQIEAKSVNFGPENYKYVQNLTARINLRPENIDNLIDNAIKQSPIGYKFTGRPTTYLTSKIRQQVYRGALGLNVGSAVRNLSQGVNTYSQLGEKYTVLGYYDLMKNFASRNMGELKSVGVLDDNIIQDKTLSIYKSIAGKVDDSLMSLFNTAETINRGSAYWGAKRKALAQGKTEEAAIDYAKELVRKTQFTFGSIDTPVALSSDLAKTFLQFKTYDLKQAEFLTGMVKNKEWAGLFRYIAASLVMVGTMGKLIGMNPTDFIPFYNSLTGTSGGKFESPIQQFGGAGLGMLSTDEATRTQATKDLIKAAPLLIPGGVQARKTIGGVSDYLRGHAETPSGNVRYQIGQNPENFVRSALFGSGNTTQGQNYFDNYGISKGEQFYKSISNLTPEQKAQKAAALKQSNPAVFKSFTDYMADKKANVTSREKQISNLNVTDGSRARAVIAEMKRQSTPEGKAALFKRYLQLRILTPQVQQQVNILIQRGALK